MNMPQTREERLAMLQRLRQLPGMTDYRPSPTLPTEPFMQDAREAELAQMLAKLSSGRQIAEGLGNIQTRTAGDVMFRTPRREKYVDEDSRMLEGLVGRAIQPMTPGEKADLAYRQTESALSRDLAERKFSADQAQAERQAGLEEQGLDLRKRDFMARREDAIRRGELDEESVGLARDRYGLERERFGQEQEQLARADALADKPIGEFADFYNQKLGTSVFKPEMTLREMEGRIPSPIVSLIRGQMDQSYGAELAKHREWIREHGDQVEGRVSQDRQEGKVAKAVDEFEQLGPVKVARTAIETVGIMRGLLSEKTSASDRAATTMLPRMLGEVGNMSTFDVKRHEVRMGIINQIQDTLSQAVNGRLSDAHRAQLYEMLDRLEKQHQESLGEMVERQGERFGKHVYPSVGVPRVREAMRTGAPETGLPPMRGAPTGTRSFLLDGETYDIPADQVQSFLDYWKNEGKTPTETR